MSHLPLDLSSFTATTTGCILTITDENNNQEYLFHYETTTVTELHSGRVQIHDENGSFISLYPSQMVDLGLTVAGLTSTIVSCQGTDSLDSQIIVTQANFLTTIGSGSIDSTKEYFLDGIIDLGTNQIEVPAGGINIKGYDFNISGLTSSEDNYIMFTSPIGGSGDVLLSDFHIEVTGTNSKVLDIVGSTGFEAYEIDRINFNNCTSLGEIDTYRQGLELGTGRFGGSPSLTLSGTWLGGYRVTTSIVRSMSDTTTEPIFKAGAAFVMNSRFLTDINCDLGTLQPLLDFSDINFPNSSTLDLRNVILTRDGVLSPNDGNLTPNITAANLSCNWKQNNGLPNTFVGGIATISTEIETTINTTDVSEVLLGTVTNTDLQHFDSPANGQLRHLGVNPREYTVNFDFILDGGANDEYTIELIKDDGVESIVYAQTRVINNLQGGRDVAYFTGMANIILNENEFVFWKVKNILGTTNCTLELNSSWSVEER